MTGFSGTEVSNKGFPQGWSGHADEDAQRVLRVTQLLEAYVHHAWSWDRFSTRGLRYAYHGGMVDTGTAWEAVAGGTVTLQNNATNYVERSVAGQVSVNQTGFTYEDSIPMAEVTTKGGSVLIKGYVDRRPMAGLGSSSGGAVTAFTAIVGHILNGQVPLSAVAQHQGDLAIAFSQLTGSIDPSQVPEGAVTQHQAALSLLFSQLTDQIANHQVPASAVFQHLRGVLATLDFLTARAVSTRPTSPMEKVYAAANFS